MDYSAQTGSAIINPRTGPSTSKQAEINSGIIYKTAPGFNVVDQTRLAVKTPDGQPKEELSREEEDRFYKKVFETSLI